MHQVRIKEMNTSELLFTCRKVHVMSKLESVSILRRAKRKPVYWLSDIRHKGSMNLIQAQLLNCRNLRLQCLTERHKQRPCKADSMDVQSRGGVTRSSDERVVITLERRGYVFQVGIIHQPMNVGRSE